MHCLQCVTAVNFQPNVQPSCCGLAGKPLDTLEIVNALPCAPVSVVARVQNPSNNVQIRCPLHPILRLDTQRVLHTMYHITRATRDIKGS